MLFCSLRSVARPLALKWIGMNANRISDLGRVLHVSPPAGLVTIVTLTLLLASPAAGQSEEPTLRKTLVTGVKSIVRLAANYALDEAGSRVLGAWWPTAKKALRPVVMDLARRFPFFNEDLGPNERRAAAAQAVDALSRDVALQQKLVDGFRALQVGQKEILAQLQRHDRKLDAIGKDVKEVLEILGSERYPTGVSCEAVLVIMREYYDLALARGPEDPFGTNNPFFYVFVSGLGMESFTSEVLEHGRTGRTYICKTKMYRLLGSHFSVRAWAKYQDNHGRTCRKFTSRIVGSILVGRPLRKTKPTHSKVDTWCKIEGIWSVP